MKRFGNLTKKLVPLFLVGAMILPITLPTDAAVKNDYQNHWAKKTIQEWIDKGYIKGVGDQGVLPNKEISRAEFVRMVNLRFGYNKPAESNKFTDVKAGSWYYNDVMYALKQGYIAGISETQFGPKMMVSREQAGTIVARIADVGSDEEGLKVFKDADKFAKYAKGPIGAAAKLKIISGYEDKTFRPKKVLTRAEAMVLLEKSYETVQKEMEKKEAKKEFKVTFDSDGGSKVEAQTVKKGQKVQKPKDPTKKDFVFDGWYLDGKKFNFDTIIDKDITLKAQWSKPSSGGGGGGGGGSTGGGSSSKTPQQAVDDVARTILSDVKQEDLKLFIGNKTPNIDPEKTMTQAVNENLDKIDDRLQNANNRLNNNIERMKKFYFEQDAAKVYATEARYNEKIDAPLRSWGLTDLADTIKAELDFDSAGYLKKMKNPNSARIIASKLTEEATSVKLASVPLYKLQEFAWNLEEPFYSSDGTTFKPVKYGITFDVDGQKVIINRGHSQDERNRAVMLLHDFYKKMREKSKDFLLTSHHVKVTAWSEVEGVKRYPATGERTVVDLTLSAAVKMKQIPANLNSQTDEQLNAIGITRTDIPLVESIKTKLEANGMATKAEVEAGVAHIGFAKLKENADKFTVEEIEDRKSVV